jgi:hypothetical protein
MSELSLTIYAMTAFTLAFLAVALIEEWKMNHQMTAPRAVRVRSRERNARELVSSRR